MVFCRSPADSIMPTELTALSRTASQVKKKILISVVSSDAIIPYYMKMSWWKGQT
jgi:tRNA splicing endonuclease